MIWIGSKKYSKGVYHHTHWKLEWGSNQFSLLGINFTLNLNEIIESNFDSKIKQIKNLIKIWSFRKLTVLGRITILKTLIISKITYLLISLPNPPKQTIEDLTKIKTKIICENKPEKIKRDILTQDYKYGGIKMPNIYHVITSLKLTWMRRLFLNDTKWGNLFNSTTGLTTKDIIIHGDYFITIKM